MGQQDMSNEEKDEHEAIDSLEGEVKWFDARKGFGFIVGPSGQDIFVHFSVIDQDSGFRTLKDGEKVIYSASQGDKGWSASHVRAVVQSNVAAGQPSS